LVDRLEELLALLEDEDDEDEREDELAVGPGAEAPAPPAPAEPAPDEDAPVNAALPRRVPEAGDIPLERQEKIPGTGGAVRDDAAAEKPAGPWDELTAVVTGRDGTALLRRPGAGDVSLAELAGAGRPPDGTTAPMTSAERGLEGLYRLTVRADRPAAQALPAGQAGHTFREEEPGRVPALTVEELDRAVRRDSRRYDGGMTLF